MSGGQMMVVMIILIVSVAGIIRAKYQLPDGRRGNRAANRAAMRHFADNQLTSEESSVREQELEREVLSLRKRLEVLERITTDANTQEQRNTRAIAAEIESLRDQ